ncbi:MAG: hypothetical protein QOI21_2002 [Actinomycetota bacterium]|jgi:uncharacterized damage-inducible protein DinB|nr:hypothetical protein [Actinomycetota bacterium]
MNVAELLSDGFDRIQEVVYEAVEGLTPEQLSWQVAPGANTVGWLVWHLTRVQDDHVAEVAGTEQVWTEDGWSRRFDLPLPEYSTGYGHSEAEVVSVRVGKSELLTGYYDAVHERTKKFLAGLTGTHLDRVVDERWDPPVTLGVRLMSVISDDLQHAGQAAYLRGLL